MNVQKSYSRALEQGALSAGEHAFEQGAGSQQAAQQGPLTIDHRIIDQGPTNGDFLFNAHFDYCFHLLFYRVILLVVHLGWINFA